MSVGLTEAFVCTACNPFPLISFHPLTLPDVIVTPVSALSHNARLVISEGAKDCEKTLLHIIQSNAATKQDCVFFILMLRDRISVPPKVEFICYLTVTVSSDDLVVKYTPARIKTAPNP